MEPHAPDNGEDDEDERRRRTNLVILVVTALIAILGIWFVNKLLDMRNIQNCLESGRNNCAPISTPGR
jgi:hypothetical protein